LPRKAASVRRLLPASASARKGMAEKRPFHATTTSQRSSHVARVDPRSRSVSGSSPCSWMAAWMLRPLQAEDPGEDAGEGLGDVDGLGEGDGDGEGLGEGDGDGEGEGLGPGPPPGHCHFAGSVVH